ncbi:ubiquitin carboxyl-terminal hydrolase 7 [Brachionus plicatilis]|uniref:Ubiquitin carboxyl-terminal hydrolase 7 n=1 Tax=Brachionus plicatilis TaxID=10195 RepID=A0A3M7PUH6_BRAPC|nr:ubiquitin carboxyl-terminal hydrolase 7 [Brachionus plicatilis]
MNRSDIYEFIEQNQAFFDRRWTSNSFIDRRNLKTFVRNFLLFLSGNDINGMLNEVLYDFEKNLLQSKYKTALRYFSRIYNEAKPKDKHQYLYPLRISGLKKKEAESLNFFSTSYMWQKCLNKNIRNIGGRKRLSSFFVDQIENHMKSISTIAANRFLKKKQTNAYYTSTSMLKAYQNFQYKDISYSSFYKYVDEKFKKPHRISDLCDYCENNKDLKKQLFKYALENGYDGPDDYSLVKEFIIIKKTGNVLLGQIELFTKIESINLHSDIANRQRDSYNSMRLNLENDYILIDMDWKQKIMIGLSPRQPSNEYRNQVSRTLFGFGIYFKKNDTVECMNIDLISCLQNSETGAEVVKNFNRFLRNLDVFKKIETKKYIIWADTGTHFRCSEVIHYLFQELSREKIKVCLNFFVEKHEYLVKKLTCSQDIADAINKNQLISNIYRQKIKKLKPIQTLAYVVNFTNFEANLSFKKVKNITSYYNFFNNDADELRSVIVSDLRISKLVEYDDSLQNIINNELNSQTIEKKVIEPKLPNIIRKTKMLKKNLRSLQTNQNYEINASQELSIVLSNLDDLEVKMDNNWCKEECKDCTATVRFRLTELTCETRKNLVDELKRHQHPTSRRDQYKKNRSKDEAMNELKAHYLKNHRKDNLSFEKSNIFCKKCKFKMGFFEEVDNPNIIRVDKINSYDTNNSKKVKEKQKREKFKELRTMFLQLKNKIGPVDPTKLINTFGNEKIWFSQQQDVNECFKKFIEKLEIINLIEYFFDTFMDLFKGNIKSILVSEEIGYTSNTFDDFIEINLVVDGKKNIYESLCELQQATYFSGDDQVIIENHGPKDCIKFQKFKKLPPILNFCLLRFKYDKQSKKQIKINDKFEFPEILDLNKYVIEGESHIFYLFAVIVHIGEIDKGHYVIYINPNCENNWYKFDDNKVSKSLKEEAIGLNFGIEEKSSAYMLTYIRKKDVQAIFKK